MNRHRRLYAAVLMLALLVVAGCGPGDSGTLGRLPTERPPTVTPASPEITLSPDATPAPSPTGSVPSPSPSPGGGNEGTNPNPPGRSLTIEVWFLREGALFPSSRTRPATPATSRLALTELVAGPSRLEAGAGVGSRVPGDLSFDVGISGEVATVELPASFYSGGSETVRLRQAQVVYTLTQFSTVSQVAFRSDGQPAGAPVGRADFAELLPPIVVTGPAIGERVTSPVTVSGTADVFEATVSVRILDAGGSEIATAFTTATCGTGCRGDYAVSVPFRVATTQWGRVQVFEVSAADGSRTHLVDIPVTLAP